MVVFLLVYLALQGGDLQGGSKVYATEAACKAQIKPITDQLISLNIQNASVSCVKVRIGELT